MTAGNASIIRSLPFPVTPAHSLIFIFPPQKSNDSVLYPDLKKVLTSDSAPVFCPVMVQLHLCWSAGRKHSNLDCMSLLGSEDLPMQPRYSKLDLNI